MLWKPCNKNVVSKMSCLQYLFHCKILSEKGKCLPKYLNWGGFLFVKMEYLEDWAVNPKGLCQTNICLFKCIFVPSVHLETLCIGCFSFEKLSFVNLYITYCYYHYYNYYHY